MWSCDYPGPQGRAISAVVPRRLGIRNGIHIRRSLWATGKEARSAASWRLCTLGGRRLHHASSARRTPAYISGSAWPAGKAHSSPIKYHAFERCRTVQQSTLGRNQPGSNEPRSLAAKKWLCKRTPAERRFCMKLRISRCSPKMVGLTRGSPLSRRGPRLERAMQSSRQSD